MRGIRLTATALAVGALLLSTGCDGGGRADGARPAPPDVDVSFGDCTKSFESRSERYVDDMVEVALSSASNGRWLYAGCFDGAPLRTLEWAVKLDFGSIRIPSGSKAMLEDVRRAHALGQRRKLAAMLRTEPRAPGSGQLEALELASQIEGLERVWLFTDAIVRQVGAIDLDVASAAEIEAASERWARRMGGGLRDVTVTFVGGGQGAPTTAAVRRARLLFEGVVGGAGGKLVWSQTSAFPNGDGS